MAVIDPEKTGKACASRAVQKNLQTGAPGFKLRIAGRSQAV